MSSTPPPDQSIRELLRTPAGRKQLVSRPRPDLAESVKALVVSKVAELQPGQDFQTDQEFIELAHAYAAYGRDLLRTCEREGRRRIGSTRPPALPSRSRGRSEAHPRPRSSRRQATSDEAGGDPPEPRPRGLTEFPDAAAGARVCPICEAQIPEFNPETGRKTPSHKRTCGMPRCAKAELRARREAERGERHRRGKWRGEPRIAPGCRCPRMSGLPVALLLDCDQTIRCFHCGQSATWKHSERANPIPVELTREFLADHPQADGLLFGVELKHLRPVKPRRVLGAEHYVSTRADASERHLVSSFRADVQTYDPHSRNQSTRTARRGTKTVQADVVPIGRAEEAPELLEAA